jgi:hypothetical protein
MPLCPECRDGKLTNCIGVALDPETDDFVECGTQIQAIFEKENEQIDS